VRSSRFRLSFWFFPADDDAAGFGLALAEAVEVAAAAMPPDRSATVRTAAEIRIRFVANRLPLQVEERVARSVNRR
jgi:hypothetical protein